eukprot:4725188-Amphidinium_carterae.3
MNILARILKRTILSRSNLVWSFGGVWGGWLSFDNPYRKVRFTGFLSGGMRAMMAMRTRLGALLSGGMRAMMAMRSSLGALPSSGMRAMMAMRTRLGALPSLVTCLIVTHRLWQNLFGSLLRKDCAAAPGLAAL